MILVLEEFRIEISPIERVLAVRASSTASMLIGIGNLASWSIGRVFLGRRPCTLKTLPLV